MGEMIESLLARLLLSAAWTATAPRDGWRRYEWLRLVDNVEAMAESEGFVSHSVDLTSGLRLVNP